MKHNNYLLEDEKQYSNHMVFIVKGRNYHAIPHNHAQ